MNGKSGTKSGGFRAFIVTLFLGAFNDNVFKLLISLLAVSVLAEGNDVLYVALGGVLFQAPFVLFSPLAGFLADRFSKKTVMVVVKLVEIAVMLVGAFAFLAGSLALMLAVLFCMGAQSAFFGPAKYGFMPEVLPDEELSKGNGSVQMWTFLAIIAGGACGGHLKELLGDQVFLAGLFCVAVACFGALASFFITPVPASGASRAFSFNSFSVVASTVRDIHRSRPLFLCMLGMAYFWLLGALFQVNILLYVKHSMGGSDTLVGLFLAAVAFGIGCGSLLAGHWSGRKVEFGLVPLGGTGLGIFSVALMFAANTPPLALFLVWCLGVSGGLFNIPLYAYIQQKSPPESKGRYLATVNLVTSLSILLAYPLVVLMQHFLHWDPAQVFLAVGLSTFLVLIYIVKTLPDFLMRFLVWLLTRTIYRIRVEGLEENVPREGGALLVCNHVSYADGFLMQASMQRMLRFVVHRKFYRRKLIKPFFRIARVVPIASDDDTRELLKSLRKASAYLEQGELVCIFAEGSITRTGNLLSFGRGIELIMRHADVPIIPVCLDRVWGSIWSFQKGRILSRPPTRLPYPVTVSFGRPMPPDSRAWQVRDAVEELIADAFRFREDDEDLLHEKFFSWARRHPFRMCMADSTGLKMNYASCFIRARALAGTFHRIFPKDEKVGVLLPASVGGALANLALNMLGKCSVNLNFTSPKSAVDAAIEKCSIRHIVTSRRFLDKAGIESRPEMVFFEDIIGRVSAADKIRAMFVYCFTPPRFVTRLLPASRSLEDPASIIFSSGTTGDPKGIVLCHRNINANVEGLFQLFRIQPDYRMMGVLPFFHSFGLTGTIWFPLTTGMGVVYHPNPLDSRTIGKLCGKYHTTLLLGTPTFLAGYMRRCTPEQFSSLRYVIAGAEQMNLDMAADFEKKFGISPLEGYGCTELSPVAAVNTPDVCIEDSRQFGIKRGTIGRPLPGVAARVVSLEDYQSVEPGEEGVLLMKGRNVMLGYLDDRERTEEVMHDGWYITGDIASIDEDGFITISGRMSRFSKIGGEMVPHIRIEEAVNSQLGAAERACAVTAVPDEKRGEKLVVLHVSDIDIPAVREGLREIGFPNLWIPGESNFFKVDELPMLGSGKLDLQGLKQMAVQLSRPG